LGYYVEDGAELYWKEGGEKVSLDDLFPQLKNFYNHATGADSV